MHEKRASHGTASLGTRGPLRDLGPMGQGREDRMQAASIVTSRGRGPNSAPRERGQQQERGWWQQSPTVSIWVNGSDIWGRYPWGLADEQVNDLQ